MQVAPGSRLGPYELVAPIGAGGMGEVWRATDTRLDRHVAIKILPGEFAENTMLRTRFEREAKTISQLNHPNICSLFDVGDNYLVMELLEGESLADRLARGPLAMSDVNKFGVQIADALDRAHRSGIVHRDLKPGNIMITKSGAKLLDFGLAKATPVSSADGSALLTAQKPLTQEGTILGTFQYMAPEQLEGLEADPRTDIFALGTVLYEMATGRRAFQGKTKTSLIASIVQSDPQPISQIQPLTPPAFEHVVHKCLAKDPDDRWQSAHDIAEELRWVGQAGSQAGVAAPVVARRRMRERFFWIAALIAALAIGAIPWFRRTPGERVVTSIVPPPRTPIVDYSDVALSPDGRSIAFIASSPKNVTSIWVRSLSDPAPREIPSTDGAVQLFWSADGKNLGFFANGKLLRVPAAGGPPRVLAEAPNPAGGAWNRDGVILFCPDESKPLFRINADGGKAVALTKLTPQDEAHRWPFFLPDNEHFVFLGDASKAENHYLRVGSLSDGSMRDVMQGITNVQYGDGYLLYVRTSALLAQPFDAKTFRLSGEPKLIAEPVTEGFTSNHHYDFSVAGSQLVYRSASANEQLTWVNRDGRVIGTVGEPRRVSMLRITADQHRIGFGGLDSDGRADDIWMLDTVRNSTSRLTFDPAGDIGPVWSPDGSRFAFSSGRTGIFDLYIGDTANPAAASRVFTSPGGTQVTSWSRDGRSLVLDNYVGSQTDIWVYDVATGKAQAYVSTPFPETDGQISPDGQWIAYVSKETGTFQVYVERFPTHRDRRPVSTSAGWSPRWRGDSHELFYKTLSGQLMSVDMTIETSQPKPLFTVANWFEPSSDGTKFLVDLPVDDVGKMPFTLVSNWQLAVK